MRTDCMCGHYPPSPPEAVSAPVAPVPAAPVPGVHPDAAALADAPLAVLLTAWQGAHRAGSYTLAAALRTIFSDRMGGGS